MSETTQSTPKVVKRAVIALNDSPRIAAFLEQNSANSFEVFDAFDGRNGQGATEFDLSRAAEITGRPLVGGEIGCAISHFRLMKQFSLETGADSDLMLIAEDDARFERDFEETLERILTRVRPIDLIVLSEAWGGVNFGSSISIFRNPTAWLGSMSFLAKPVGPLLNSYKHRVGHVKDYVWGAGLYLVSREAARRIVSLSDSSARSHWLSDAYHYFAPRSGIDVLVCRPGLASWEGESSIKGRRIEAKLENGSKQNKLQDLARFVKARVALKTRVGRVRGSLTATRRDLRGGSFPYLDI
ncbi:glycosyltransferase family 25 protein [Neomicrococcus aestuarii]|uniref:glycosyltransferase family 25 protein n=1 Tax=Neomicrococcus aestuarii TaxID=556325 RepID=UPI00090314FB|nr:glycosyltransferase family 25 protein [Neomicrococcus aestuarii]